jgi:Zn-dependent peptidase ImmA (M78 family)
LEYDRARYQDKWRLERLARRVRTQLGLSQTDVLDPWRLADAVPAHVFYPEDLLPPMLARRALAIDWDGFAFAFPDDRFLMVVMNPARSRRRQCATLLAELSHHLLRHQPSRIYTDQVTGQLRRDFNQAQEEEAYDLGSVLLLPKELIQQHVKETAATALDLADRCGCSSDLVELRIKRCRLWNRYVSTRS